ncbi:MAG: hypothetical protein OXC07_12045 [Kistimonas sp.]|nr:hypothetical protein [Kistimonas sp.]
MMKKPFQPISTAPSAALFAATATHTSQMTLPVARITNAPVPAILTDHIKQLQDKASHIMSQRDLAWKGLQHCRTKEQNLQQWKAHLEHQAHLAYQDSEFLPRDEDRKISKQEFANYCQKLIQLNTQQAGIESQAAWFRHDLDTTNQEISLIARQLNKYQESPQTNRRGAH